jgi:hypothetical protein
MALLSPNPEKNKNPELYPIEVNPENPNLAPETKSSEQFSDANAARENLEKIEALKKIRVEGHALQEPQSRTVEAVKPLPPMEARQYLSELLSGNRDIASADDAHDLTEFIENHQSDEESPL